MINSKIKFKTIMVLFTLAVFSAASIYVFQNKVSAAGFQGKIFTTTFGGQSVGQNHYSSKDAVYLSGGPQNQNHALPDGSYYFQVTGPGGNDLLSTDAAVCRQLIVFNGRIAAADGPSCQHPTGIPESAEDGATPIKLMPFNDTPNPGGNYKAWLIAKTGNTTVAADGIHINFKNSDAKSEIFRADSVSCPGCSPTSVIGGRKFYDANANGLFDQGEVTIQGVQIFILAGDTQTLVTTNASGAWSTTVPTGAEYLVLEFLPFTGPDGQPGSYWQQTAPFANSEGIQGYLGTVTGDQANLDFGNICFNPDAEGNPVASSSPCSVSDLPPPDPTPAPTPTPCPDCSPTAVLSGKKFYDANANAVFDVGEVPVAGVQILVVVTTGEGTTLMSATTDGSGNWSLIVPAGAQYIIGEDQPFTDPELEPGAYWEQTAPLANEEGFRGYSGTVGEDQSGFNFGNVCFHEGNPVASPVPCSVWYPAPPPTPTPTPDNQ
jgi:hypothetical protein